MQQYTIGSLIDVDRKTKPAGADDEWITSCQYYDDRSRQSTIRRLAELGVGLANNRRPIEISLLRRIIDRLAIVYDSAPTRWLVDRYGARLSESDPRHVTMTRTLDLAQYDLAWRRVDKLRALLRQVVIRYYPSDARGSVVMRIFEPHNVMRQPIPYAPDQIEYDEQFALRLCGADEDHEVWEHWVRDGQSWSCTVVDRGGEQQGDQPYSGYDVLPVQIVYDEYSGGRAWIPPRFSRTSFVDAINAISNDLWALIVNQAHSDRFFKTDNPDGVPSKKGPGMAAAIPADTDVIEVSPNPRISECQSVLESFVKLWSVSEDLPVDEFLNRQVLTGPALKVADRALNARREAQILLAPGDERAAYRKLRAVHNVHCAAWGLAPLDESTDLDVEIGDTSDPIDMRELQEGYARSIALGSRSVIDLIQAEQSVSRTTAIKVYERVAIDREAYPPPVAAAEIQSGPRMAGVSSTESEMPDMAASNGKASVMDVIQ